MLKVQLLSRESMITPKLCCVSIDNQSQETFVVVCHIMHMSVEIFHQSWFCHVMPHYATLCCGSATWSLLDSSNWIVGKLTFAISVRNGFSRVSLSIG